MRLNHGLPWALPWITAFLLTAVTSYASLRSQRTEPGIRRPVEVPHGASGRPSRGRLRGGVLIPAEGEAHFHLFRERGRGWGTADLVQILLDSALELRQQFPMGERLQIGDLSAEHGGRIKGHASHQNGLDVDLAYLRLDRREQRATAPNGFDEDFADRRRLSRNFDLERNWALMKILVSTGRVSRIFVGHGIKRGLCAYAASLGELETETETLRRLQPFRKHDDHLHLRITCPADDTACVEQEPPAPGHGCPASAILAVSSRGE